MIEFFRKSLYAGIGATVTTKETVEKSLQDLVSKGKLTADEARQAADKVIEEGRKEYETSRTEMNKYFTEMLNRANVVTADQLKALESRVAELEKELANLREPVQGAEADKA